MIITIDGPAGSGKSSTALEVARRLDLPHIDSGSLYRAFALAAQESDWVGPNGEVAASRITEVADAEVDAEAEAGHIRPLLAGRRLDGEEIRTPQITACASFISAFPEIRDRVNAVLRRVAARVGGAVCEGRDMGTVVFPEAELKVYMDAAPKERARRRLLQRGDDVSPAAVRDESARLVARDTADSERALSPLRVPDGALVVDTTHLSFDEQVERILAAARARLDMSQ